MPAPLHSLSTEALLAQCARGESPLAAAAALVARDDLTHARMLLGAAAFLDPDEIPALCVCDGTDALAMVALSTWLPLPPRIAAAESLARAPLTAVSLAALTELTETSQKPPYSQARGALDAIGASATESQREQAERLRHVAKHIRDKVRGEQRRNELQREVARGLLHPIVGVLSGDAEFIATLVPPIADEARAALLPHLIALARHPNDAVSKRAMAWFQRRWRELATPALSGLARTPLKGRDADLPAAAVRALAALGALDEVVNALTVGARATRVAALTELEKAPAKARAELDATALIEALEALTRDDDGAVATRARALSVLAG